MSSSNDRFSDEEEVCESVQAASEVTQTEKERELLGAVLHTNTETVRELIQDGVNVNAVIINTTPLCTACMSNNANDDIVRILLDAGADARWKNAAGQSAMLYACNFGHLSIVQMLFQHDNGLLDITNNEGKTPLLMAIFCERSNIAHFLLDQDANVHATSRNRMTTLAVACLAGDLRLSQRLAAAGVSVEAPDEEQRTALYSAAKSNHFDSVDIVRNLILQHNANMFAVSRHGSTPFDAARQTFPIGPDIVEALLELYGSKLQHEKGSLALHALLLAAEYAHVEGVGFHPPLALNELQVSLPLGKLALQHFRTLMSILDAELIHNRDASGKLPIHIACQNKAPVKVLALLLEHDAATLHIADYSGALPLHECCRENLEYASVRFLVEQGGVGTLAARDHQGALPLHVLCASTNPSVRSIQYLIQSFPGSVAAQAFEGQYPCMIAACESSGASLSVVYELVRANPDLIVPS